MQKRHKRNAFTEKMIIVTKAGIQLKRKFINVLSFYFYKNKHI